MELQNNKGWFIMIADFYKEFKEDDPPRVLPAKVVAEFNKTLPKGYRYQWNSQRGEYFVCPSHSVIDQKFTCTVDYEKYGIPKTISQDHLAEYLYRTQKTIELDNVRIIDDDQEYDPSDVFCDPITGQCHQRSMYLIQPMQFPSPVGMEIETSTDEKVEILFRRMPYDSMDHIKIGNVSFPALKMEWIMPEKQEKNRNKMGPGRIHIVAIPKKAESVHDALLSLIILRDFANGKLKINKTKIGKDLSGGASAIDNEQLNDSINFWQSMCELETIIGVRFNPAADYPNEDEKFASELIHNMIKGKDLIFSKPFKHFHLGFSERIDRSNAINKLINTKGFSLSFIGGPIECTLLGANFTLYETNVLVDMIIDQIVIDEDKRGAEIYISNAPDTVYKLVKRFYMTEKEARDNMTRMFAQNTAFKINKDTNDG